MSNSAPNCMPKPALAVSWVPALAWLGSYQRAWLRGDVVAGLTAAAVVVPQAMAYGAIAGLPLVVGLYTALVPLVIYAFMGTSRPLSVTTTSTIAILARPLADVSQPRTGSHQLPQTVRQSAMISKANPRRVRPTGYHSGGPCQGLRPRDQDLVATVGAIND